MISFSKAGCKTTCKRKSQRVMMRQIFNFNPKTQQYERDF